MSFRPTAGYTTKNQAGWNRCSYGTSANTTAGCSTPRLSDSVVHPSVSTVFCRALSVNHATPVRFSVAIGSSRHDLVTLRLDPTTDRPIDRPDGRDGDRLTMSIAAVATGRRSMCGLQLVSWRPELDPADTLLSVSGRWRLERSAMMETDFSLPTRLIYFRCHRSGQQSSYR